MNAVIRTIKGERSLDFTFKLWFFLGIGLFAVDWLFTAITARTGPSVPVFIIALLIVLVQISLVYGLGIGVLRSAMVSDRPKAFKICAAILVGIAMAKLPFVYYDAFSRAPTPVMTQTASDNQPVQLVRDAAGLTDFQRAIVTDAKQRLPATIDDVTTLQAIAFEGSTLIYSYDVEREPRPDLDLAGFKTENLAGFCKPLVSLHRPGEIEVVTHRFGYASGREIEITVRMGECRSISAPEAPAGGNFITKFEQGTGIDL